MRSVKARMRLNDASHFVSMLKKKYRLTKKEIEEVFKNGKSLDFYSELFYFKYLPNTLGYSRFAVIVPKKIVAKATGRNKIRRILYESLWKNWKQLPRGINGVLLLKKPK